jgi:hypothetical protein
MKNLAEDGLDRAASISKSQEAALAVISFVGACRNVISSALDSSPPASLAWGGLCTILPVGLPHGYLGTYSNYANSHLAS